MQTVKSQDIKCKEYCLNPSYGQRPNTVEDALNQFKEECPEALIADIKLDRPLITFFYTNNIVSETETRPTTID